MEPVQLSSASSIPKHTLIHTEPYEKEESHQKKLLWNRIFNCLDEKDLDEAYNAASNLLHYLEHRAEPSFDSTLGKICCYMMQATIYSYRRTERADWYASTNIDTSWDSFFFEFELDTIEQKLQGARTAVELSTENMWQNHWAMAIGNWTLRGGYQSIADMNRKDILEQSVKSLECAEGAYHRLKSSRQQKSSSQLNEAYIDMMHTFSDDLKETLVREGHRPASPFLSNNRLQHAYPWGKLMYITLYSPEEVRETLGSESTSRLLHRPADDSQMSATTGGEHETSTEHHSDTNSTTSSSSESRRVESLITESDMDDEEEMTIYTRIMSRQIMDIYRQGSLGEDSDDSDLDLEELAVFRDYNQQQFQTDVDVIGPRAKYEGHCNIEVQ